MKVFLKNIRLSVFAVLFGTSVWAQNSNPTGRKHCILDADTKESVAYASVGVVDKYLGTVSDADGTFVMEVPEDLMQDILRISALGYSPFRNRCTLTEGTIIWNLSFWRISPKRHLS